MEQTERQAIIDQENLRLLPLFYWVSGGFWALYGLFMVVYFLFMGAMFVSLPFEEAGTPPLAFGWTFIGMGAVAFLFMAVFVALKILAGFWLVKRKNRIATMVAAALSCLEFPYGTLVGVLTFIVLARPSVVALYETPKPSTADVLADENPPI
ncbi:MAG: hypothetical protein ACYCXR_08300 [Coriobacteriia bacterium]